MTLLTPIAIETVLDEVYSAAVYPGDWQKVCDKLVSMIEGARVSIVTYEAAGHTFLGAYYAGHSASDWERFTSYYHRLNPILETLPSMGMSAPVDFDQLVDPQAFVSSEFYTDWLRPQNDLCFGAGFVVGKSPDFLTIFSIYLPRESGAQSLPHTLEYLDILAPHIRRAQRISKKTDSAINSAIVQSAMMEVAQGAFLVLDGRGRLLDSNRQAKSLFESGFLKIDAKRQVDIDTAESSAWLENVVSQSHHVAAFENDSVEVRVSGRTSPYIVRAITLRGAATHLKNRLVDTGPALALSIYSGRPSVQLAQRRYALSRAETEVLAFLLDGSSTRDIAKLRATSINTVRNQISSILAKTETSGQKELISQLAVNSCA